MTARRERTRKAAAAGNRAAVYARVSTSSQVDSTSLPTQLGDCRATASRMNLSIVDEFVDAGVSGAKSSRPQLDQMLEMARSGQIDVVLVAKLDRLGRSLLHLLSLLAEFDQIGVQVVSISEGFDTRTSVGKLQLSILGSVAEFERERTRDRIMSGLYARVDEGGFVSSKPPFGYRTAPDPRGRGVVLQIDPEQELTVRRAFHLLVIERLGTTRVAEILNSEGRVGAEGPWTRGGLIAWARRKGPDIIAGTWTYGGVPVPIPPILNADEAALMRAWLLGTRSKHTSRGPYLLSGLLHTPCGSSYIGRHAVVKDRNQSPVYVCASKSRSTSTSPDWCGCSNISMQQADHAVWREVVRVLTDPTALKGMQAAESQTGDTLGRINALSRRIQTLQSALVEEYQGAITGGFDATTARLMVQGRQSEMEAAKTELARLGRAAGKASVPVGLLGELAIGRAMDMDSQERRTVMEMIETRVEVSGFLVCSSCDGRGRGPASADHRFGAPCTQCNGMKRFPELMVHMSVPEELFAADAAEIADAG